jgi:Fe-S cluster assembly protein SufD
MSALPNPVSVPMAFLRERALAAGESVALVDAREKARELLFPFELPQRARHLWKYTDPIVFVPKVDPTVPAPLATTPEWQREDDLAAAALVAGGRLHMVELDDSTRRAGVEVINLHTAGITEHLGRAVPASHGFVEAINAAAWSGGVLVRVPAGVTLEQPIRLRFAAGPAGSVNVPRVLVLAGEGSSFEVVEGHTDGDLAASQVLAVSEIFLGAGADVRYGIVQRWQPGVIGHLTARAFVEHGARLQLSLASFGGALFKADVGATLAGEHAQVETYGVSMGGDHQHLDHHTEHIHAARSTRSSCSTCRVAASRSARRHA